MKSLNDLREFYLKTLRPDLKILDDRRKKIVRKLLLIGVPTFIVVGLCLLVILANELEINVVFVPFFLGIAVMAIAYHFLTKKFIADFKSSIIQRIVRFVDENLRYLSSACVSESEFKASRIFRHRIDRYRGDDLVQGRIGKTDVKFSEVHAEYKTETRDSKGNRRTQWHTIFKGLFYIADFNKHIRGEIVILPDTAERLFDGWVGSCSR